MNQKVEMRALAAVPAIAGDEEAAKRLCGSYLLVRELATNELYRADSVPPLCELVTGTTDADGFLFPRYWGEKRWDVEQRIKARSIGDCVACDNYVLSASEAPYCPTCARLKREGKAL